jgi:type 1 fimbria pilin
LKLRSSIVAAIAVISSFALVAPASASEVCYDVNVNVNGQVISQAGCQDLP